MTVPSDYFVDVREMADEWAREELEDAQTYLATGWLLIAIAERLERLVTAVEGLSPPRSGGPR